MKTLKVRSVLVACLLAALLWMPALAVQAADGSPAGFFAQWTGWWTTWTSWWAPQAESVHAPTSPAPQSLTGAGEAETGVTVGSPTSPTQNGLEGDGGEDDGDVGSAVDPFG